MTNLSVFNFGKNQVRVVTVNDEPWFVAKDLCQILEISNSRQVLSRLDKDEKNTVTLNDGTPGNPNLAIVSESGMYALTLSSRKPEAKPFRKWLTSEVLPSIRKTGSYSLQRQQQPTLPDGIKTEITTITKQRSEIQAEIKEHEEAITKLKNTYRKLDDRLLELANQFIDQHSEVVETYLLCKKEVNQMVGNPYDARYDKFQER